MTALTTASADAVKVYSPALLAAYDWLVLGFNARLLWRCRAADMLALYDANVSAEHLDIGVGTGYFLDKCRFPVKSPKLTLFDLNENSLAHTARRVARYRPEVHRGDVLEPLPFPSHSFKSVALSAMLHCVPGNFDDKSLVFEHVARCLVPNGTLFGSTIVNVPERMSWLGRRALRNFNRSGVFSNLEDTPEALEQNLGKYFDSVKVRMIGALATFTARAR